MYDELPSVSPVGMCRLRNSSLLEGLGVWTLYDLRQTFQAGGILWMYDIPLMCRELDQAWRETGLRYGVDYGDCELLAAAFSTLLWLGGEDVYGELLASPMRDVLWTVENDFPQWLTVELLPARTVSTCPQYGG